MDRDKQKKINRNNRKRGSAFEKRVASILDMDLVPYSGSNARFGYGDIRDSLWLGECKNITADVNNRVTILHSWLDKNIKRAEDIGHIPFLAFVANGRPSKYIILDESTFYMMNALIHDRITLPKASKKSVNLIISLDVISKINNKIIQLDFDGEYWYIMSIERFKDLINKSQLKGCRYHIMN